MGIIMPMTDNMMATVMQRLDDFVDSYVTTLYTCGVFLYLLLQYKIQRRKIQKHENERLAAAKPKQQIPQPITEVITDIGDFNLTGTFKMVSNENMDAFLTIQGVPWALRRAAAGVMPNHHITHIGNSLTIRIHAAGLLETTTSYTIHGPMVETVVRGRIFRDTVVYHQDPVSKRVNGIQTEKTAVTEGYQVKVLRILSEDKNRIYMTSSAVFPDDPSKAEVVSKQEFVRISDTSS